MVFLFLFFSSLFIPWIRTPRPEDVGEGPNSLLSSLGALTCPIYIRHQAHPFLHPLLSQGCPSTHFLLALSFSPTPTCKSP